MEVIKRKSGNHYREKIFIHNKLITKTFKRKADAETWKKTKQREKDNAEALGTPAITDITLSAFTKLWFQNKSELAPRSIESYSSALSCYLVPAIGHLRLRDIRIAHAHSVIAELKTNKLSPSRIKLVIGVLNQLLNDAIKWDYLMYHPFKNLQKIKVPAPPEKYWMPHQIKAFLNANFEDEHYAIYVLALNTGMRIGEIMGLQWNKVDFENEQIEVSYQRSRHGLKNKTKSGKIAYVPMNEVLTRVLRSLKQESRSLDFVFAKRNGEMINSEHFSERILKKAILRAGVEVICFRNLRTTFASNYVMLGGDILVLSKIMNHSSVAITHKKYAHLHPSYMKGTTKHIAFEADSPDLAHAHLRIV